MRNRTGTIIWVIAIIAVIAAAFTFYTKNKSYGFLSPPDRAGREIQEVSGTQPAESSKIAAPDFTLKDLEGNEVKLSDYKGKVIILNFWAVWCKYCKLEMPDLNELNAEFEKSGEAVILAVDVQESQDIVEDYLSENKIGLKVLMDTDGSVAQTYGITGYPTTFVVDGDGYLYTYISGATDKETVLEILDRIKKGLPVH